MKHRLAAIFAALLISGCATADPAVVVDGDTIRAGGQTVRVMGLDAPELHGRCPRETELARAARDRLAQLIAGGVTLEPHGSDRYRRLLAVVRDARGRDVAQVMVAEGLARPYAGARREPWCEGGGAVRHCGEALRGARHEA